MYNLNDNTYNKFKRLLSKLCKAILQMASIHSKTLETSIKTSTVGYPLLISKCFKLVSQMNEMYLLN